MSNNKINADYKLPCQKTLENAVKISIVEDKSIHLDYWTDSLEKKVIIGAKDDGEKILVKSDTEYTSTIAKLYKSNSEYIVVTENSIYIVSTEIESKKISL